ncbi:hypothetical protein [Streptomyces sp. NPDC051183]|uniref:hypothetical protein n=1 Tax=Streptomyces sp. NPDC051183 TaxID=3155165 RepID=UPI00342901F0
MDTSGYPDAGLLLAVLAAAVIVTSLWRSGALDRAPTEPPAVSEAVRGPERMLSAGEKADQERSLRLLKAIDDAADDPTGEPGELSDFERIVLYGVAELPGRPYPPAGHDYPRP